MLCRVDMLAAPMLKPQAKQPSRTLVRADQKTTGIIYDTVTAMDEA